MQAKVLVTALGALLLGGVSLARADSAPEHSPPLNEFRAGLYYVTYHVDATDITGPYVPPGVGIDVNDVTTAYLAYVRTLSTHWALELALGWPPLTETVGQVFEVEGRYIVPLPHASGVSRWLNAPANRERLDQALRELSRLRLELRLAP